MSRFYSQIPLESLNKDRPKATAGDLKNALDVFQDLLKIDSENITAEMGLQRIRNSKKN